MRNRKLLYVFLILAVISCKQRYDPPITNPTTGYLVVEGVINSGVGATNIHLSRTTKLSDANEKNELHAQVTVEGESSGSFALTEKGQGLYSNAQLTLNGNQKYRLHIRTLDGKEYLSDFTAIKRTPPIDTISWDRPNGGIEFYVDTHNPQNNTRYYRWEYEQTWEFHSTFFSTLKFVKDRNGVIIGITNRSTNPAIDPEIYTCWRTETSTDILIGSSARLLTDTIHGPLAFIPPGSNKVSVLFSIYVKQYALSEDAYEFYSRMKKNTEQTGSLFDPQPSALNGNIHCVNSPNEIVIGFVDVADLQDKRIFVPYSTFPDWRIPVDCMEQEVDNDPILYPSFEPFIPTQPIQISSANGAIKTFGLSSANCVDCTLTGTNVKPSFWP